MNPIGSVTAVNCHSWVLTRMMLLWSWFQPYYHEYSCNRMILLLIIDISRYILWYWRSYVWCRTMKNTLWQVYESNMIMRYPFDMIIKYLYHLYGDKIIRVTSTKQATGDLSRWPWWPRGWVLGWLRYSYSSYRML